MIQDSSTVQPSPRRKRVVDYLIRSTNSVGELLLLYFAMLAAAAFLFAWFEHKPIVDSFWWAVVTTTTTGYGDISPVTLGGRLMASFVMLVSILFVLPLLIGHIALRMIEDHDAFTHHEQEQLKAEIAALRADLGRLLAKLEG